MVPCERSCHKEYTCEIWKPYLLRYLSNGQCYSFSKVCQTSRSRSQGQKLWYHVKGLVIRNTHVKCESPTVGLDSLETFPGTCKRIFPRIARAQSFKPISPCRHETQILRFCAVGYYDSPMGIYNGARSQVSSHVHFFLKQTFVKENL